MLVIIIVLNRSGISMKHLDQRKALTWLVNADHYINADGQACFLDGFIFPFSLLCRALYPVLLHLSNHFL